MTFKINVSTELSEPDHVFQVYGSSKNHLAPNYRDYLRLSLVKLRLGLRNFVSIDKESNSKVSQIRFVSPIVTESSVKRTCLNLVKASFMPIIKVEKSKIVFRTIENNPYTFSSFIYSLNLKAFFDNSTLEEKC